MSARAAAMIFTRLHPTGRARDVVRLPSWLGLDGRPVDIDGERYETGLGSHGEPVLRPAPRRAGVQPELEHSTWRAVPDWQAGPSRTVDT